MIKAKIRDRCDIRICTQIWPTERVHVFISRQVINNVEFRISLQNPYFKDQVIKTKSEIASIKGDVLASGLQSKYMSFSHRKLKRLQALEIQSKI